LFIGFIQYWGLDMTKQQQQKQKQQQNQRPRRLPRFADLAEDILLATGIYVKNYEHLNSADKSYCRFLAKLVVTRLGLPYDPLVVNSVWLAVQPNEDIVIIINPDTGNAIGCLNRSTINLSANLRDMVGAMADTGSVSDSEGNPLTNSDINRHDEGILGVFNIDLLDDEGWLGDLA
jgi:hypothetical protein